MLIASKTDEEIYAPEVRDFVYITDNTYSTMDIKAMEREMLKTLDYSFGNPLCLHFLRRNSRAGDVSRASLPLFSSLPSSLPLSISFSLSCSLALSLSPSLSFFLLPFFPPFFPLLIFFLFCLSSHRLLLRVHTMAKFLMELCLPHYSMLEFSPSLVAASALYIANKLYSDGQWVSDICTRANNG